MGLYRGHPLFFLVYIYLSSALPLIDIWYVFVVVCMCVLGWFGIIILCVCVCVHVCMRGLKFTGNLFFLIIFVCVYITTTGFK